MQYTEGLGFEGFNHLEQIQNRKPQTLEEALNFHKILDDQRLKEIRELLAQREPVFAKRFDQVETAFNTSYERFKLALPIDPAMAVKSAVSLPEKGKLTAQNEGQLLTLYGLQLERNLLMPKGFRPSLKKYSDSSTEDTWDRLFRNNEKGQNSLNKIEERLLSHLTGKYVGDEDVAPLPTYMDIKYINKEALGDIRKLKANVDENGSTAQATKTILDNWEATAHVIEHMNPRQSFAYHNNVKNVESLKSARLMLGLLGSVYTVLAAIPLIGKMWNGEDLQGQDMLAFAHAGVTAWILGLHPGAPKDAADTATFVGMNIRQRPGFIAAKENIAAAHGESMPVEAATELHALLDGNPEKMSELKKVVTALRVTRKNETQEVKNANLKMIQNFAGKNSKLATSLAGLSNMDRFAFLGALYDWDIQTPIRHEGIKTALNMKMYASDATPPASAKPGKGKGLGKKIT